MAVQQSSALLALPAELRDHIWKLSLKAEAELDLGAIYVTPWECFPALMQVCQQTRYETLSMLPYYYSTVEIRLLGLEDKEDLELAKKWVQAVGDQITTRFRKVVLVGHIWSGDEEQDLEGWQNVDYQIDLAGPYAPKLSTEIDTPSLQGGSAQESYAEFAGDEIESVLDDEVKKADGRGLDVAAWTKVLEECHENLLGGLDPFDEEDDDFMI